jgi:acetylornithine aminotransferase
VARAAALGTRLLAGLRQQLAGVAGVTEIRGRGLLLAIELERPCKDVMQLALDERVLVNVTADNVVRLLPPMILADAEADDIVTRVARAVKKFLGRT